VGAARIAGEALVRARSYLNSNQDSDGMWSDFRTPAGASTEWVTAFVGFHLGRNGWNGDGVDGQTRATLAARQRRDGGWGYHDQVPTDADSTAWAVLAAGDLLSEAQRAAAKRFLLSHQQVDGGFATYTATSTVDGFIGREGAGSVAGWTSSHTCVTASSVRALRALGVETRDPVMRSATASLQSTRDPRGLWRSYWWNGIAYPTLQAAEALTSCGEHEHTAEARAAIAALQTEACAWAWSFAGDDEEGAFETALALILLLGGSTPEWNARVDRGVAWLCHHQRGQGRWDARPILRIPLPTVLERELLAQPFAPTRKGFRDRNGVFTASVAVACLELYLARR